MSKVTREEMLACIKAYQEFDLFPDRRWDDELNAILALIEHGPEVDEETLESLLGERSLYGIIRYLRQKGVTVKEAQNQNEIYQDEGPGLQEEGDK